MKRLLLALLLAGCVAEPVVEPELPSFRDRSVPIASQVDVTVQSFVGAWHVRQSFASGPVAGAVLMFDARALGTVVFSEEALECQGDVCGLRESRYDLIPRGQGRWQTESPSGSLPDGVMWILWMDADDRTAAIGTPDGTFGWIMTREREGGEDRIAAAREIMAWMGYRVDEMEAR